MKHYKLSIFTIFIIIQFIILFNIVHLLAQSTSIDQLNFDFPLKDNTYNYGPIVWYYGATPEIVEDTRYGIHNPDLSQEQSCFGNDIPLRETYHAGEDWYRFDKLTGEMLETAGAEVKAVAEGTVVHVSTSLKYPGDAIVIEHNLSPAIDGHDKIYSVYMHLEDVFVANNHTVAKGEIIGTIKAESWNGLNPDPARPTYDSHLHWEMRYFFDGSNIYDPNTTCNKTDLVAGRGYTYPEHPDDFPSNNPYVNPSEFVGYKPYLPFVLKNFPTPPTPTSTPIPTVTPTSTATPTPIACIEGEDLIINGDLEDSSQHYLWVEDDGDPIGDYPLIDDNLPYQGIYSIWLGGRNNALEQIYQTVTMPSDINAVTITFMFYVYTTETTPQDYDTVYIDLKNDTDGQSILPQPFTYTNQFEPQSEWTPITISINNLNSFEGTSLRLSFGDITDYSNITSFFIDNIALITQCQ